MHKTIRIPSVNISEWCAFQTHLFLHVMIPVHYTLTASPVKLIYSRVKLTDSIKAVDVLSSGTLLRDVDVLQGLVTTVA